MFLCQDMQYLFVCALDNQRGSLICADSGKMGINVCGVTLEDRYRLCLPHLALVHRSRWRM